MKTVAKILTTVRETVDLADVFVLGGIACAAHGVAQIHAPSAWILIGVAAVVIGARR